MIYLFLNCLSRSISWIGFKGIYVFASFLGIISFDILRIRRKIILKNLDVVFGDTRTKKEKMRMGKASTVSFFCTALEFLASRHLCSKAIFEFENKEILPMALAQKHGVYALCIHMSNWEYLCHIVSTRFAEAFVVAKDLFKGDAERWVKETRTIIGFNLIDRAGTKTAAMQIFKGLEKEKIIGFIVDQKRPNGRMLPLFGVPASTNDSLAKLYFKKQAPIIPIAIRRKSPGHFIVKMHDEFKYERNTALSQDENVHLFTQKMNQLVETMILENPNEYYWFHNRWSFKKN